MLVSPDVNFVVTDIILQIEASEKKVPFLEFENILNVFQIFYVFKNYI